MEHHDARSVIAARCAFPFTVDLVRGDDEGEFVGRKSGFTVYEVLDAKPWRFCVSSAAYLQDHNRSHSASSSGVGGPRYFVLRENMLSKLNSSYNMASFAGARRK